MTTLNQPDGWADRKLAELKALGQSEDKPYVFLTSCVDSDGESINAMREQAADVLIDEMAHNCDLHRFEKAMGYGDDIGLRLPEDLLVSYHRSVYRGSPCYYLVHSAIEYIWVNARSWKAERVLTALEQAGVEVDVPNE